ncbi:MAG: DPP IV N-terminal domain-containing protein [Pyrinomonadaceae bacterium]|nr:DPP IV N-terminal domain-containing protein [Pyrinomonadaceae bacterium]
MKKITIVKFALSLSICILTFNVFAQTEKNNASLALTASDYQRAEKFLNYNTSPLVDRAAMRPNWLSNDRFWYRNLTVNGSEFILFDTVKKTQQSAFNQVKVANALSTASGTKYEAAKLPFADFSYSVDEKSILFNVGNKRYLCDIGGNQCALDKSNEQSVKNNPNEVLSPDKTRATYIKDHNLWMRDVATNKETQLTTDGVKDFGYATDNAGWTRSDRAIVLWSPDSKKIATFQQDQRGVGEMYLVSTNVGHPTLQSWKYPLPGDKVVTTIQRVIIEVDNPKVIRLQMPADEHRSTLCDDIACGDKWDDVEWSADCKNLAFVSTSRDHKKANLRIADASTGAIRDIYEETTATQFESGQGTVNWRYLPATNEFIWYTERDNWGHLYLYDLTTGKLKNQITTGEFVVTQLVKVDEKNRLLYFNAVGREKGRDPYFSHLYRIGFNGKKLTLLTPEDGNHQITLSPSEKIFIDSFSKPDVPAVTVMRDLNGKLISNVEKTDISRLVAKGWKPPQPIVVKARDELTDLHGLMFTPTNLDITKKYPIVNYIYPGPQTGSVGSRSFSAARGDNQALAELGFVVVAIDGTCNPLRSKKFHDACYGNMADNTLPDQITAMKQLAAKYPYIDIERAGIWGHSGGGFAAAAALFRYPEFFKVGISESGNHDNRNYEDDWGERYIGLLTDNADGKSNYEDQANQNYAKNLKGHLLLAHGTLDDNVPPYNTLLVVDALVKANKDFDLLMLPNQRHGFGNASLYMTRRRWDYFVRYLMGAKPPSNYELRATPDSRNFIAR